MLAGEITTGMDINYAFLLYSYINAMEITEYINFMINVEELSVFI